MEKLSPLHIHNGQFKDQKGRVVTLRGLNVGSKKPSKVISPSEFFNSNTFDFKNRPFSLSDADLHFRRFSAYGINVIRWVITWEAIEPHEPGTYDQDFLSYLKSIWTVAASYNIWIYIDPHQDVWSRFTGGSGVPFWTFTSAGLDPTTFHQNQSAITTETTKLRPMQWPTNYFKYASATMFTLFFAGNTFAPSLHVQNEPIQDYLQRHYINAMNAVLSNVVDLGNILGIGTMNEPSPGFINVEDLGTEFTSKELKFGWTPTPFDGMVLADGNNTKRLIYHYTPGLLQLLFGWSDGQKTVQSDKSSCGNEIWKREGVWHYNDDGVPVLLKPDYFSSRDFGTEFYLPFARKFAARMMVQKTDCIIFIELPPREFVTTPFPLIDIPNVVNATHWYDGVTLFLRSYNPYFTFNTATNFPVIGKSNVTDLHVSELREIKELGRVRMNNAPTLVGECGIPFNLSGSAFKDFSVQEEALDHTLCCLEANLLSYTLWCYDADNTNAEGDFWNQEDLSVYSKDQEESDNISDLLNGTRAAKAFVRPYAMAVSGIPTVFSFSYKTHEFRLEFEDEENSSEYPTIVFLPKNHYPDIDSLEVECSDGKWEVVEEEEYQRMFLKYYHTNTDEDERRSHWIKISLQN